MNNNFDPCADCRVKNYDGKEVCPLPVCLYDVYDKKSAGHHLDVQTIVLWEKGLTIEDIQKETREKHRSGVVRKVNRWRNIKREMGLLI